MLIIYLIVFQVFLFIGLILIFRKVMTKNVVSATLHIEGLNQDYTRKEQEINRQLEEAKLKSQEIIAKAETEAAANKIKIVEEAQKGKEDLIVLAIKQAAEIVAQAEKSKNILLGEIETRVKKEALQKACELLAGSLPDDLKKDAHVRWIDDLIQNGFENLKKQSIESNVHDIVIRSAFPLTDPQKQVITKKIDQFTGKTFKVNEVVDPQIIAGMIVEIGSLVLDGSLKNRFQSQVKALEK